MENLKPSKINNSFAIKFKEFIPSKGYKHAESTKRKISESRKGQSLSVETKWKIGYKLKGNKNKLGKKNNFKNPKLRAKKISQSLKGHPIYKSEERNRKISNALKGKPSNFRGKRHSEEAKNKNRLLHLGKIFSEEHRRKLREFALKNQIRPPISLGINNPSWKGGITPLYEKIRHSLKYELWRKKIFQKNNYTCQDCGKRGWNLEVHHLKPFSKIIEEYSIKDFESAYKCEMLWDISNGITFCQNCHGKIDFQRRI